METNDTVNFDEFFSQRETEENTIKVFNINKDLRNIFQHHFVFENITALNLINHSNIKLKNFYDDLDSYAENHSLNPLSHLKIGGLLKNIADILLEREKEKDSMPDFNTQLKEFRKFQKLTQVEFAQKIGITTRGKQTIMEWETGKREIPKAYKILFKLLFVGKITFEDFTI